MPPRSLFYPGNRFLIVYLSFISAFAPISTDMYLPALPAMARHLGASDDLVSYSISLFLMFFALSMLIWGPLSDKYGRKPILIAGSLIYLISSVAIVCGNSVFTLLFWRVIQGIGSGAVSSISLAVVKDVLRGPSMEKVITIMQAATILAPLSAPIIGGALLLFTDWQGIFLTLALCGLIALLGALALKETNSRRNASSLTDTFRRIASVLSMRCFVLPLLLFSAMAMPFMSYLALSAFIFQDKFGLSAQGYSMFFAINAAVSLIGPFIHMFWLRHYPRNRVITIHLLIMCCAGICVIIAGSLGPWFFALLFAPVTLSGSAMRTPSTMLMLESVTGDNGIVASLINCGGLFFGSLSMFIASLPYWPGAIFSIGCISSIVSGVCLLGCLKIQKSC